MNDKKSSISGFDANTVVLICYIGALILSFFNELKFLAWLLPLAIYIIEKESEFVKKHSAQSTILFAIYALFSMVYALLFMILFPNTSIFSIDLNNFAGSLKLLSALNMISFLIWAIVAIFTIIAASKAWKYENYDIPVVKNYVQKLRKKIDDFLEDNKNKSNTSNGDNTDSGSNINNVNNGSNNTNVVNQDNVVTNVSSEVSNNVNVLNTENNDTSKKEEEI